MFGVRGIGNPGFRFRINHARGEEQLRKAVVVEIRNGRSPADIAILDSEARPQGRVVKVALTVIAVEDFRIASEVRLENVEESVAVEVADAKTHACLFASILARETPRSSPCSVNVPS